jgi:hypothetical protein
MKKEILAIALMVTVVLGISSFVLAQANVTAPLPPAGLLPDNPFYGFKKFFENLQLFFTFNSEGKAKLHLQFAEQRLAELNQSLAENKTQNIPKLEQDYQNELNETGRELNNTRALGRNATELAQHIAEETFKHQLVLENLLNKVPEQAKIHIENVINESEKWHNQAVESILENRNVTGIVNITFTIGNQTFIQAFNVTTEHGKPHIERNIEVNESMITFCTQDSDCIPICNSWCGNANYYKGRVINCPMIPSPALPQPECVCQNNHCTKL